MQYCYRKKKIPKQWFKMQTFIISHNFCGSRTGGQLSLVVLAQDLSCRNGQSPPSGTEWEVGCWSSCGLASVFFIGWSQGFSVASHHMDWIMLPHSMTALDFLCGSSGSQTEYFKREREQAWWKLHNFLHPSYVEGHIASHWPHS